jgi:subtilisin-like proprotein convertase family protein
MTNTRTITTKTSRLFRALVALVAMLAAMFVAGGVALAATTTFGNYSAIQIPTASGAAVPYPSQISVQKQSGNITDVNLKLNGYSHTWPDDTGVLLVGPQGQKALIMSDAGGLDDTNAVDLTLDDEATSFLPENTQIFPGTYKPTQGTANPNFIDNPVPADFLSPAPTGPYATSLSVFDNTNPNGTWALYVSDDTVFDVGQIASGWSLDITTASPPPRVQSTSPQAGATGVSPRANVKATFSEDMQARTINNATFKLFKRGSTTKVGASVSYDATADKAKLDPTNRLKRGATYKAVITTDARDLEGNSLDQNPTLYMLQRKAWTFKVKN